MATTRSPLVEIKDFREMCSTPQDLFKKTKSLLNKLTPNNFQTLKTQAMGYPIDTEERLTGIIDLVFEKVGRLIS